MHVAAAFLSSYMPTTTFLVFTLTTHFTLVYDYNESCAC